MGLNISAEIEARLMEEAQREGIGVESLLDQMIESRAAARRLPADATGAALLAVLQACPYPEVEIAPTRVPLPVRDVVL